MPDGREIVDSQARDPGELLSLNYDVAILSVEASSQ